MTLKPWAEDEHMLQTAHIINIVNVFDKSWSTAQVRYHEPLVLFKMEHF